MDKETDVKALIESAEAAIREVENSMRSVSESFYRDNDLDPENMKDQLESVATDESRAQALAQFQADMEAAENEATEEMARRSFSGQASRGSMATKFPLA
jgi:hypothetical protein